MLASASGAQEVPFFQPNDLHVYREANWLWRWKWLCLQLLHWAANTRRQRLLHTAALAHGGGDTCLRRRRPLDDGGDTRQPTRRRVTDIECISSGSAEDDDDGDADAPPAPAAPAAPDRPILPIETQPWAPQQDDPSYDGYSPLSDADPDDESSDFSGRCPLDAPSPSPSAGSQPRLARRPRLARSQQRSRPHCGVLS